MKSTSSAIAAQNAAASALFQAASVRPMISAMACSSLWLNWAAPKSGALVYALRDMSKAGGKTMRLMSVFVLAVAGFALGATPVAAESKAQGCMFNGKELKGKVQIVNS